MKRIIDIDENIFTRLFDCVDDDELSLSHDELDKLETSVRNSLPYEERPQGRWIRYKNNPTQPEHIKCSNCGQYWSIADHDKIFDICFKCGADMKGGIK